MINKLYDAMKACTLQQFFGEKIREQKAGDSRYNNPKEEPKTSQEKVEQTIEETEIYRRAKELILKAQQKQVAYGLDKYPTPLSADVWDILETIDHILDESVDKLHYLVMLRIHLERLLEERDESFQDNSSEKTFKQIKDAVLYADEMKYMKIPADMDGDYVHEYTNYLDEEPNFRIYQQPDYKRNAQEISITMTISNDELAKHDDSVDALTYSIRHHLDKMKNRGLI